MTFRKTSTMRRHAILLSMLAAGAALVALAQSNIIIEITKSGGKGTMAVPDFRGSGAAAPLMATFNSRLWSELDQSGLFRMAPKTMYPPAAPQQPQDWRANPEPPAAPRRGQPAPAAARPTGFSPIDWSGPPVSANYMPIGYVAVQGDQLTLFAWFYNVSQPDIKTAQVFAKVYTGPVNEDGAKKIAVELASDILGQFGITGLAGSRVLFVSNRTGVKEIWSMDYDGSNQKPFTSYRTLSTMPSVSPDGGKVAFLSYVQGLPQILIHSLETGRRLPFYNQTASMNAHASFTPDGKSVVFSSTAAGGYAQIYISNANGSGLRRLTNVRAVEVEPKVNPKTGSDIVFVSGRSGPQQIYKMNMDGADVVRLTTGEGEASNPAWHPDGRVIAFAWTRGFEPGNFNIFVMDVATGQYVQLTHGAGRNENPTWAPDGRHIAFARRVGRTTQIYSMLADGTQLKQLTTQGNNEMPVWTK
jgi:TolB protein